MSDTQARAIADAAIPGAVIVGGAHVSVAVARSLGRRGVPVWLLANHPLPKFSRYIRRRFDWPGADHPDGVSSIVDLAKQHNLAGWVLIAAGDQDMRMIAQNHALLSEHFRVATPDWGTIQWVYDKRFTYQRAAELGIDFPRSFQPHSRDEAAGIDCRFPVILKPAFRKGSDEFTQAKAWKAETREKLIALYQKAAALVGNDAIIVQEWIPGTGTSQFSFAGLDAARRADCLFGRAPHAAIPDRLRPLEHLRGNHRTRRSRGDRLPLPQVDRLYRRRRGRIQA